MWVWKPIDFSNISYTIKTFFSLLLSFFFSQKNDKVPPFPRLEHSLSFKMSIKFRKVYCWWLWDGNWTNFMTCLAPSSNEKVQCKHKKRTHLSSRCVWWTPAQGGCGHWPGWPPSSDRFSELYSNISYPRSTCSSRPGRPASPHHTYISHHLPTSLWESKDKKQNILNFGTATVRAGKNVSTLTSSEGVHCGIGPLLTDVRQSNRTITVLPTTRWLSSYYSTVLLLDMFRLVWRTRVRKETLQNIPIAKVP